VTTTQSYNDVITSKPDIFGEHKTIVDVIFGDFLDDENVNKWSNSGTISKFQNLVNFL